MELEGNGQAEAPGRPDIYRPRCNWQDGFQILLLPHGTDFSCTLIPTQFILLAAECPWIDE